MRGIAHLEIRRTAVLHWKCLQDLIPSRGSLWMQRKARKSKDMYQAVLSLMYPPSPQTSLDEALLELELT